MLTEGPLTGFESRAIAEFLRHLCAICKLEVKSAVCYRGVPAFGRRRLLVEVPNSLDWPLLSSMVPWAV